MSDQIIGMRQWFETPPGRYLLAWERAEFDRALADIFGVHALQLGLPELDTLRANRMPHRWLALREVERVLVPEGRVVIAGFNPTSLWGLRQRAGRVKRGLGLGRDSSLYLPRAGEFIGYWRLRDWLRLLGFEVEGGRFGCYRPPFQSERWLQRFAWMDPVGDRWWPVLGSVYFIVAVKRVRGMRLVGLLKNERRVPKTAAAVVTNREPAEVDS
jgi:hypothetical protein